MPIGYWIHLCLFAFNPFATYEKARKLLQDYEVEAIPEAARPDSYYDSLNFERLVTSGVESISDWRAESLRRDVFAGRVFGYKGLQITSLLFYPGLTTCSITGNVYRVEAAVILGFRVLYSTPTEAYPVGNGGCIGQCF